MINVREMIRRLFGRAGSQVPVTNKDAADGDRRTAERTKPREELRILVVDDSRTIVAVLSKMLQQNGYQVLQAGDGREAMEQVERHLPDLVFLDIVMPGMNGFEALRELRRLPETQGIPVIMMSGNEQATEAFYVQRIGADDFMKKPFSRAEVFSRIERMIGPDGVPRRIFRDKIAGQPARF
ncbi:MAG: response regulator [Xanthomonadales bacterium]|nr:response regulator [Xanthomonadales bacterium]